LNRRPQLALRQVDSGAKDRRWADAGRAEQADLEANRSISANVR
jgi:hypothetical protein